MRLRREPHQLMLHLALRPMLFTLTAVITLLASSGLSYLSGDEARALRLLYGSLGVLGTGVILGSLNNLARYAKGRMLRERMERWSMTASFAVALLGFLYASLSFLTLYLSEAKAALDHFALGAALNFCSLVFFYRLDAEESSHRLKRVVRSP